MLMSRRTAQRRTRKICRILRSFVTDTDGNEKADELGKAGAMLDEGYMAEARSETMQQERERSVCREREVWRALVASRSLYHALLFAFDQMSSWYSAA